MSPRGPDEIYMRFVDFSIKSQSKSELRGKDGQPAGWRGLVGQLAGGLVGLLAKPRPNEQEWCLLMVPLDHIKSVKHSGLLRLMTEAEKELYLRMREDLRKAFRIMAR